MNIKEQIKENEVTEKLAVFIRDDINKFGLTKDVADIPAFANTILNNFIIPFLSDWLQSNNYYQLQADSEGLIEIINPCGICEYNCPQEKKETCVMYQYYTIKILALKAQKALCDAEKAEAVKKVFSSLRSKMWHSESQYCDREYRITVEDYEATNPNCKDKPDSSLLLSDEVLPEGEIKKHIYWNNQIDILGLLQAELDHLAKPEMELYKKVEVICKHYNKALDKKYDGLLVCDHCHKVCKEIKYIPLSDYMKGEGK